LIGDLNSDAILLPLVAPFTGAWIETIGKTAKARLGWQ